MSGIILLLGLCVVMALASFLAGALPLSMTLSQSQLRLISSIGVGVLVGTSMIIIIPEGVEAAAAPAEAGHEHKLRSLMRRNPWAKAVDVRGINSVGVIATKFESREAPEEVVEVVRTIPEASTERRDDEAPPMEDGHEEGDGHDHEHKHEHSHAEEGTQPEEHHDDAHVEIPSFEIGFSMVLGFILMFLIDRIPRHATESMQPAQQTQQFSLDTLGPAGDDSSTVDEEQGFLGTLAQQPRQARSFATTLGLVIHAAADGIAMGASSTTSDTKLGLIIFIAIMIHKAPAAFGLTSVLLRQGLSKRAARAHLIVFSLAAPIGALSTWLLVTLLGGGSGGEHGQWWTGMLMLFSGGTFLYVAMHAMQEDAGSHDHGHGANGFTDAAAGTPAAKKQQGPRMQDTLATVVGMLLPLLAQLGGHHHH
ncbi:ZIP zinc transporter domain-containing protein [Sarocladium implicatum]|nr:ZIP zinc transporter domain-containing protein [Sarocladium implicatum]